jgi:hypothetical protein
VDVARNSIWSLPISEARPIRSGLRGPPREHGLDKFNLNPTKTRSMRSTATNLGGFVAGEQVEPVTTNSNGMTQTIIVTPAKPNSSPCRQKHQAGRLARQQLLEPRGRKSKRNLAADKPFRFDVARLGRGA